MRALIPAMKERGWGRVINISSILGLAAKESRNVYCATKFGLIGLTRSRRARCRLVECNRQCHRARPLPHRAARSCADR